MLLKYGGKSILKANLYIKLLRIKHWIKNILIYIPMIFSGGFLNFENQGLLFWGWLSFSFITSFVYVINDLKDINEDKNHLTKRYRPLASGKVRKSEAYILCFLCLTVSLVIQFLKIRCFCAIVCLLVYVFINLGYSFGLKNIPIIDITILASGYIIRIIFGASLAYIRNSKWLILTIIAISFYMGFGKRRNEYSVQKVDSISRKVLKRYNYSYLDKSMYVFFALSIAFYSFWAGEHEKEVMIWTVPMVIALGLRYNFNVEMGSESDPVEIIYKDKVLLFSGFLFSFILFLIIYISDVWVGG